MPSHWDAKRKESFWRAPHTEIYHLEFLLNATLNIERKSEIQTLGQRESWKVCILSKMGLCSWEVPAEQQWHTPHSLIQETLLTPLLSLFKVAHVVVKAKFLKREKGILPIDYILKRGNREQRNGVWEEQQSWGRRGQGRKGTVGLRTEMRRGPGENSKCRRLAQTLISCCAGDVDVSARRGRRSKRLSSGRSREERGGRKQAKPFCRYMADTWDWGTGGTRGSSGSWERIQWLVVWQTAQYCGKTANIWKDRGIFLE